MSLDSVPEIRCPMERVSLDNPDPPRAKLDTQNEIQMDEEICYGMVKFHYPPWHPQEKFDGLGLTRTQIIAYAQLLLLEPCDIATALPGVRCCNPTEGQIALWEASIGLWEPGCYVLMSSVEELQEPIAVVDSSTTEILEELGHRFACLRFQAHFSSTACGQNNQTPGDENIFPITINVYGPCTIMNYVGKALSLMKIYLQQPDVVDSGVRYDNPHYLKPQGYMTPWITITNQREQDEEECNENQASADWLLTTLLDCQLMHVHGLKEQERDSRITTPLLRYICL